MLNSWCYLERVTPRCYLWFRYKVSFRVKMHTLIFRFLFNQLSSGSEISFESILGILVTLRGKLSWMEVSLISTLTLNSSFDWFLYQNTLNLLKLSGGLSVNISWIFSSSVARVKCWVMLVVGCLKHLSEIAPGIVSDSINYQFWVTIPLQYFWRRRLGQLGGGVKCLVNNRRFVSVNCCLWTLLKLHYKSESADYELVIYNNSINFNSFG